MNPDNLFDLYPCPRADHMASDPLTTNLLACAAAFMGARVVVEAGSYQGRTTCAMAKALRRSGTPGFRVWTADTEKVHADRTQETVDDNDLTEHVTVYHGDFLDMLKEVPGEIDFAYLDGGERWPMVKAVRPRLSEHGLIFIDDMNTPWDNREHYNKTKKACVLYLPGPRGLGVIKRK